MPLTDRVIRVFISSTFRDMTRERDLLVKRVFPELRHKCARRFVTFTEVDLRWGITEEQAAEGQVLPLCLEGRLLHVAMRDPHAAPKRDELGRATGFGIQPYAIAEVRALDRMNFPSAALFERDSSDLSDEGKALIKRNIETGRDMFSRANAIIVVGHTDNKWDDEWNMKLSKERAATASRTIFWNGRIPRQSIGRSKSVRRPAR